jgi:carbamoyl-phosphate synthase large subunit
MRSTGEVMGIADDFGDAFARAQSGTGTITLPRSGTVFLSVADRDKRAVVLVARRLVDLGLRSSRPRGRHGCWSAGAYLSS